VTGRFAGNPGRRPPDDLTSAAVRWGMRQQRRTGAGGTPSRPARTSLMAESCRRRGSLGEALLRAGRKGEAIQHCRESPELNPRNQVVNLPEARNGFLPLPRRWAMERSFVWAARFRRLVPGYEHLPEMLAALRSVVFAIVALGKGVPLLRGA
jgi:transposase